MGLSDSRAAPRFMIASSENVRADPADSGIRITVIGIIANLLLVVGKVVGGILSGSLGLIADGAHSASDVATDLAVIGGIRLGAKKADSSHPYGHGKFETMAGGFVAFVLIGAGLLLAWEAGSALYRQEHSIPGPAVIVIAAIAILVKEWLYRSTRLVAIREASAALHANAWHHRSDALSSVAVLLGGIVGQFGWGHADQAAGIAVGVMVALSGAKTLFTVIHELTEGSVNTREQQAMITAVEGVESVNGWHQFRSRSVGREIFVDLHVVVDPDLSVVESHKVSMNVEEAIQKTCTRPVNIVVHVEPDIPDLHEKHD